MPRRETGRVVAESRYDPRCDTIGALDGRLVAFVRSGTPLRRALSAAALSREVRDIDVGALESGGVEDDDEAHDREVLRVRVPPRVTTKSGDVKRTLRRVAGEWLPTEACAELVAAEVISALGREVDLDAEPAPLAQRVRAAAAEVEPTPAPDLPPTPPAFPSPFVEALVAGLGDAGARELDARLCRAAALERGVLARIGPLLLAFADLRGPFQLGFRSLDAYARERLGMSPRKARALLRLERACALAPVLGQAWREGWISASQAHTLLPLLLAPGSEPFHAAWIQRAAEVTVRRLADDVEHALAMGAFDPAWLPDLPEAGPWDPEAFDDPLELPEGVQTGAEHMARQETDVWAANVPADVARLFRGPRAHRVFARDGWRCTVPGCTSQRNLHAHHVLLRSAGGSDDLANLTTLCAAHHQRGVHAGVIRIAGRAPGALVFEMPLGRFRSGDRALAPA